MIRPSVFLALFTVLAAAVTQSSYALTQQEMADIFKTYDVEDDDSPDCQEEDIDAFICPKDEKIGCGPITSILDHCTTLLGADIVASTGSLPKETGANAVEGCVRYVGYHVFEENHMACCESDVCEDWIDEQFEQLGGFDDDDDDMEDMYDDDEDDDMDDDDEF